MHKSLSTVCTGTMGSAAAVFVACLKKDRGEKILRNSKFFDTGDLVSASKNTAGHKALANSKPAKAAGICHSHYLLKTNKFNFQVNHT